MTKQIPQILSVLLVLGCATTRSPAGAPPVATQGAGAPPVAAEAMAASRSPVVQATGECAPTGNEAITLAPDAPLETAVETVACAGRLARASAPADRWYIRRYRELDGRPSPLEAATMILAFTLEGPSHLYGDLESFGYLYAYARGLSLPSVEQELQSYPDATSQAFLIRLNFALKKLDERATRLHGLDRAIFVDLLSHTLQDRLVQARALASFEEETTTLLHTISDALDEGSPDRLVALLREAEQLREAILVKCTEHRTLQECLDGPLIRPLSERLVQLAQATGDIPRATAEREELSEGVDHTMLVPYLHGELHHALISSPHSIQEDEANNGVLDGEEWKGSPATLAWGPAPAQAGTTPAAQPAETTASAKPAETIRVHGVIKSARPHAGGMAIILEEGAPVVVPCAEAHVLKYGEKLDAIVDPVTRRGVVLYAHHYASSRIVQFRGTRLGGTHGVDMATHLASQP